MLTKCVYESESMYNNYWQAGLTCGIELPSAAELGDRNEEEYDTKPILRTTLSLRPLLYLIRTAKTDGRQQDVYTLRRQAALVLAIIFSACRRFMTDL